MDGENSQKKNYLPDHIKPKPVQVPRVHDIQAVHEDELDPTFVDASRDEDARFGHRVHGLDRVRVELVHARRVPEVISQLEGGLRGVV